MERLSPNPSTEYLERRIVSAKANTGALLTSPREELEEVAPEASDPQPKKHGNYWTIVVWKDEFQHGKPNGVKSESVSHRSKPSGARCSDSKTNTYGR